MKNKPNGLYCVVMREFGTGRLIDFRTFNNSKDAQRWRYHLQENPTIPDCRITVEVPLRVFEKPKELNRD